MLAHPTGMGANVCVIYIHPCFNDHNSNWISCDHENHLARKGPMFFSVSPCFHQSLVLSFSPWSLCWAAMWSRWQRPGSVFEKFNLHELIRNPNVTENEFKNEENHWQVQTHQSKKLTPKQKHQKGVPFHLLLYPGIENLRKKKKTENGRNTVEQHEKTE